MEDYKMKKRVAVAMLALSIIVLQVGCSIDNKELENVGSSSETNSLSSKQGSNDVDNSKETDVFKKNDLSGKSSKKSDKSSSSSSSSSGELEKLQEPQKPVLKMPTSGEIETINQLENKSKGWGQGIQFDENNCPITVVPFNKAYGKYGGVAVSDDRKTKNITLTFDQGYENGYTPKILDALKEKNVSAVFFVTMDYAKRNDELMKRMIKEGHTIGNHTTNHPSMPSVSVEQNIKEIALLHNYILDKYDYNMTVLRPPMGEFSSRTLQTANLMEYKTIMWSFAYKDWDPKNQMGADTAKKKVIKAAHNGAIYLLHAVSKDNAEILGDVIDELSQNGFGFDIKL